MAFRSADEAALDAAIEHLTRINPGRQCFVFGPSGTPFWAAFHVTEADLRALESAVEWLQRLDLERTRPFTSVAPSGAYSVFALDVEGTLFAVVLHDQHRRNAEARVKLQAPPWLRLR